MVYPPSRLDSYVVMRSPSYPWVPVAGHAGVAQRHLGYFFECGPNVKMLQIKAGSKLPAYTPDGHRAMFLLSGRLSFDGQEFDALSYFVCPDGQPNAEMVAQEDSEMLAVGWTTPGKSVPFLLF